MQRSAYLYALAAVLLWSTVATAFKLSLRHLTPVELLFYASVTSTVVLGTFLTVQGSWHRLFAFTTAEVLQSALLGLLNPFLYYLVLFKAYDLLPAHEAQPLNYTWAIALAFMSVPLLGHRVRLRDFAAAFVCYSGVIVIATRGDVFALRFSDPWGVGLALGSAFIWAAYWIGNTRRSGDPAAGLFLNFLFSLVPVTAAFLILAAPRRPTIEGLLGGAYVGTFEMGLTFLLWQTALRRSDNASKVGNLIFLSPFLSLVFIRFVLGEIILFSSLAGLALIVAGLIMQRTGNNGDS